MKIYKFHEYSLNNSMINDFINSFGMIKESDEIDYKSIQKKIISDLKLNSKLITTFGAGIGAFYPIVSKLMSNTGASIDLTPDKIVLLTIAAVSIIYLEEKKSKNEDTLRKDSKSMLEELKMMGIGNGIVKKLIEGFKSIKNIFSIIGKHLGAVAGGFIDMFAYTSLLIPIMNGISFIVGKYDLNLDTLAQNFIGLGVGLGTIVAKHGLTEIIGKLSGKFTLNKKKIMDEIEVPVIQKIPFDNTKHRGVDLIKEQ